MNRWCIYYSGAYSTSYSISPCKVMYSRGGLVRVELPAGERRWLVKEQIFKTSTQAHAASSAARGVNAWA